MKKDNVDNYVKSKYTYASSNNAFISNYENPVTKKKQQMNCNEYYKAYDSQIRNVVTYLGTIPDSEIQTVIKPKTDDMINACDKLWENNPERLSEAFKICSNMMIASNTGSLDTIYSGDKNRDRKLSMMNQACSYIFCDGKYTNQLWKNEFSNANNIGKVRNNDSDESGKVSNDDSDKFTLATFGNANNSGNSKTGEDPNNDDYPNFSSEIDPVRNDKCGFNTTYNDTDTLKEDNMYNPPVPIKEQFSFLESFGTATNIFLSIIIFFIIGLTIYMLFQNRRVLIEFVWTMWSQLFPKWSHNWYKIYQIRNEWLEKLKNIMDRYELKGNKYIFKK